MKNKFAGTCIVILVLACALFSVVPLTSADSTLAYKLVNLSDGTFSHTLNVVVPQSLVNYYESQNHRAVTDADFPKFFTPYAVQPIAHALRQIYPSDEDFTNGVLTLVHQIPYAEIGPEFYPAETLVNNEGDCDLFSFLAASVLEAGGLEVVLLHYVSQEHMNIGVHLDSPPENARFDVYSVSSSGVLFYVAECTSTNWQEGWRVGECPEDLQNVKAQIIPLDRTEVSPGQVSASFQQLSPTTLDINAPLFTLTGSTLTVTGQISPALANQNVTLYETTDGSHWTIISTTMTAADGKFTYSWASQNMGKLDIRASWTGNDQYAGATSPSKIALVLPIYLVALIGAAFIAVVACIIALVVSRRRRARKQRLLAQEPASPVEPLGV